ncbi:thioesterase II family protein [Streptomyces sp. NPDC019443]|uniref:thioesterase II family protein n=1 Tax=Streptomyces sp. NPDC019443 TaxID=3365061 RepID=UPI0037A852B6
MASEPADFGRWILRPRRPERVSVQLVCAPYAGGGPAAYHGWATGLPETVDVWLLRLAGRGRRRREPLPTDLDAVVRETAAACAQRLREPFVLFGHSLGAFTAYELAKELALRHGLHAAHLVVAARPAPHVVPRHPPVHTLPTAEFLKALDARYQGVPDALREDPALEHLYLPVLRADMALLETYRYRPAEPLDCPISVFGGRHDHQSPQKDLAAWRVHTRADFTLRMFPGNHFFVQSQRTLVLQALTEGALRPHVACPAAP